MTSRIRVGLLVPTDSVAPSTAVVDIDDPPLPLQPFAVGTAVAGAAAVVHVQHGEAAARPELDLRVQDIRSGARGPPVGQHQQRRPLTLGRPYFEDWWAGNRTRAPLVAPAAGPCAVADLRAPAYGVGDGLGQRRPASPNRVVLWRRGRGGGERRAGRDPGRRNRLSGRRPQHFGFHGRQRDPCDRGGLGRRSSNEVDRPLVGANRFRRLQRQRDRLEPARVGRDERHLPTAVFHIGGRQPRVGNERVGRHAERPLRLAELRRHRVQGLDAAGAR